MKINQNSPFRKENHSLSHQRWLHNLLDKTLDPCLRCGARFIHTGRRFTVPCVEGRIVPVRVCRACAQLSVAEITSDGMMRRAA